MARPRLLRYSLLGLASLLVVLMISGMVLGVVLVRRPFPEYSGEVTVPGLRSTVAVQRDEHGVAHLYADSPEDLFRAQGYVQAQDQFFTMEWRRHVAAGRLSELVGEHPEALASDKLVRTLGWRRIAEAEEQQLDPTTRSYLQAFTAGVSDDLTGRSASQLSLNYTVLSLRAPLAKIEPWTIVDTLSWYHAMAWQLRGEDEELTRVRVLGGVKDLDRMQGLYPDYPYDRHQPVLSTATAARLLSLSGASGMQTSVASGVGQSKSTAGSGPTKNGKVRRPSKKVPAKGDGAAGAADPAIPGFTAAQARQLDADSATLKRALIGEDAQVAVDQALRAVTAAPAILGGGRGVGANAVAVSGALTQTGKPLLADDPQLLATLPGAWYQMGLHCRTVSDSCPFDVSGFTFAGVPGIVIGHNARISWGLNSQGPDLVDYYLEQVDGDTYRRDGKQLAITTRQETIAVAGGDPVTFTVRSTVHGPIVSDLIGDVQVAPARSGTARSGTARSGPVVAGTEGTQPRERPYAVSIAWAPLQAGHTAQAVFALDKARDFASFRTAAQLFDVPGQSFVYADVDGHIGYQLSGRIPLRRAGARATAATATATTATAAAGGGGGATTTSPGQAAAAKPGADRLPGDGSWPLPGWNAGFDWSGFLPADRLPWVLDPADGVIIAANQPVAGPSFPVKLAAGWDYGYRAQRIRSLVDGQVEKGHKLTVADLRAIQGDTYNPVAAEVVPLLLQVKTDSSFGFTAQARDLLKDWDYRQQADSPAAAYFNAVWFALLDLTFSDELPEGARPDGGQRWFEVIGPLLKNPHSQWWDDRRTPDVVEAEAEVLRQAMIQARLRLTSVLGKDPKRWQWGQLHQVRLIGQPLGGLSSTSVLNWLTNEGPIGVGGGSSVVNAMGWDAASGSFGVTEAPSLRMIVNLGDLDGSRWANSTGQSAHPGQGHYLDQLDDWVHNRTSGWPSSPEAVRKVTTDTLTLKGPS